MLEPAVIRRRTPLCDVLALLTCLAACSRSAPAVRVDAVEVRMVARDTAWQASYVIPRPGGAATEIPTGREVHVPLGAEVRFALTSIDYISDFALPGLGLRDFAAPGLPSEIRFTPRRAGRYDLRGDQLCGLPRDDHARGWLVVEDPAAFRDWVRKRARGATG